MLLPKGQALVATGVRTNAAGADQVAALTEPDPKLEGLEPRRESGRNKSLDILGANSTGVRQKRLYRAAKMNRERNAVPPCKKVMNRNIESGRDLIRRTRFVCLQRQGVQPRAHR